MDPEVYKKWYEKNRDAQLLRMRLWKKKNRKHQAEYEKRYAASRPEWYANKLRKAGRKYAAQNKQKIAIRKRKHHELHPEKRKFFKARRRAFELRATPKWANKQKMIAFYKEALTRDHETGIKHHVDHIVPLRHPTVCGLHCEFNLQVLTKEQNLAKGNRFD